MSQEAMMILLDNSDWARNGDYQSTRWEAQYEVATLIANQVCTARQENTVGLITMAGRQVQVHLTPVNDHQKFLACLHHVKLGGSIQLMTSIQIACLALQYRENKLQKSVIFAIVASPVTETEEQLTALGLKLKKLQVGIKLINIGEVYPEQISKLEKFVQSVSRDNNSQFINIMPNITQITDALVGTAFLGNSQPEYNNNENMNQMDPELAQVLQISLEEHRQQQNQHAQPDAPAQKEGEASQQQQKAASEGDRQKEEEKKLVTPQKNQIIEEEEDLDEEQLLKRAKEISLQPEPEQDKQEQQKREIEKEAIQDPKFINELFNMIPELNSSDPQLQSLLQNQDQKKDKGEKKDSEKDPKQNEADQSKK